jgi:hypothetical protein
MEQVRSQWFDRSPIPPPHPKKRVVKILRPKPAQTLWGICLNQELLSVDTHWDPRVEGKVRCGQMYGGECMHCPDPERRWYGYMPVLFLATGRVACLEITWAAAAACPQLSTKRVPLRGWRMEIGRYGTGKFGRCYCKAERYHKPLVLPPAEPIEELLDMVFGPSEDGLISRSRRAAQQAAGGEGGRHD